jgi:hypothetical protein
VPPVLQFIDEFPWSASVMVISIAAMLIFRRPIRNLIYRSRQVKAGPVTFRAGAVRLEKVEEEIKKIPRARSAEEDLDDVRRLVIPDCQGRPRILASTVQSGEPFLALLDEEGEARVTLAASASAGPAVGPLGIAGSLR